MLSGKLYYRIGEVAEYLGEEPSTLRFWEKEFKQIRPVKRNNERLYRPEDVQLLELIRYLLREEKYTIEGAKRQLQKRKGYILEKKRLIDELTSIRDTLKNIRDGID
ncbi:MAG: MerR family transcriptional regulator [Chlorobi bacterium]|nr:MerR family transcriptional regulator [Chlorobiota bacterium]